MRALRLVVLLGALGLAGAPAGAQAVGPGGRLGLVADPILEDVDGRVVGPLVAGNASALMGLLHLRGPGAEGLLGAGRLQLFSPLAASYESLDCSGDPFVEPILTPGTLPLLELAVIDAQNRAVVPTGGLQQRVIKSRWQPLATPACELVASPVNVDVRATVVVTDLGQFVPPFRLRP